MSAAASLVPLHAKVKHPSGTDLSSVCKMQQPELAALLSVLENVNTYLAVRFRVLFVQPLISIRHDIGQCSIVGTQIQKLYFKNITTQIIHLNVYNSKHEATML